VVLASLIVVMMLVFGGTYMYHTWSPAMSSRVASGADLMRGVE
jgi:hypothetical protein